MQSFYTQTARRHTTTNGSAIFAPEMTAKPATDTVFFSIVIPTYNRADFLPKTIASLDEQAFRGFEVIVVDDGSTDNTPAVLEQLQETYPWLRALRKPNAERGAARNYGTQHARGTYVTFLDSDDLLYPNHLQVAYEYLSQHDQPAWYTQNYEFVNGEGRQVRANYQYEGDLNRRLVKGNVLSCMGVFLRKDIAEQHPFEEDRRMAASEDYELWLRLAPRHRLHYQNVVTAAMVEHEDRSVLTMDSQKLITRKEVMLEKVMRNEQIRLFYTRSQLNRLLASNWSYIALHIAMSGGNKQLVRKYWWRSVKTHLPMLLTRRSFAVLKRMF